ncbi:hypothetical protein IL306_005570 [Fusarium sp. DS 682]|nr:hypothetical protein IL306_005570 [Fusarium sp. DS 682]
MGAADGGFFIPSPSLIQLTDNGKGLEAYPSPRPDNAQNRRRLQNRESQRRFRERKEQLHKTLQEQLDNFRAEYDALLGRYTESTAEASLLRQESDALRSEVNDLRRQRKLMLSVMKMLRGPRPAYEADKTAAGLLSDVIHYLGDLSDDPATPDTR